MNVHYSACYLRAVEGETLTILHVIKNDEFITQLRNHMKSISK